MYYSQHAYKDKLGTCARTIYSDGCFITSVSNLFKFYGFKDITPPEMNKLCKDKGFYVQGCALVAPSLSKYFDLTYERTVSKPKKVCIAETDHYAKKGFPQHFFVIDPVKNERLDPLDENPTWEKNDYHIVSYRVFGLEMKETKSETKPPKVEEGVTTAPAKVEYKEEITVTTEPTPEPIQETNTQTKTKTFLQLFLEDLLEWLKSLRK